jgi:hypothetical protein
MSPYRHMSKGVRSGTAVVEDVLSRRLAFWAAWLHTLAVADLGAGDELARRVKGVGPDRVQQLQVLLDTTGHEELSDFIRLLVYNSSNPCAGTALYHMPHGSGSVNGRAAGGKDDGGSVGGSSSARSHGSLRETPHSSLRSSRGGSGGAAAFGRRMRAAGVFQYLGGSGDGVCSGDFPGQHAAGWERGLGGLLGADDPGAMRFARLLPPGHALTKTAEELKRRREFQEALAAARRRDEEERLAARRRAEQLEWGGEPEGLRQEPSAADDRHGRGPAQSLAFDGEG